MAPSQNVVPGTLGSEYSGISPIVVYGSPRAPTAEEMLVGAFDLKHPAEDYSDFGAKWRNVNAASLTPVDALVKRVELHFDWLTLTRTDPQLPTGLLPDGWPGAVQGELLRQQNRQLDDREIPAKEVLFAGEL